VVIGGAAKEALFSDGAVYNPSTRAWRPLPPLPSSRTRATLTCTGTEVIVAGGMAAEMQSPMVQTDAGPQPGDGSVGSPVDDANAAPRPRGRVDR
jgi:hypothetical protein